MTAVTDRRGPSPGVGRDVSGAGGRFGLVGDVRIQLFGVLFGLGTVHHELQFILEQYQTGPLGSYMERWAIARPTIGWPSEVGIALHLLDLLVGAMLVVLPWRRALLMLVAVSFGLVNLVSPERIPSHNSLMLAALAVLLVLGLGELVEQFGRRPSTDWYGWTLRGLIWLCSLTYAFAAFHKLNTVYLSLTASTAPTLVLPLLEPLGVTRRMALPLLGYPVIYGTLAIEVALPILLLWRRTRLLGCFLGTLFHLGMMARGIMDFPTTILAFYPLYMTVEEARCLLARFLGRPSVLRLACTAALAGYCAVAFTVSEYIRGILTGVVAPHPVAVWAHAIPAYATLVLFAYVVTTLGAMLFERRSPAVVAPSPT